MKIWAWANRATDPDAEAEGPQRGGAWGRWGEKEKPKNKRGKETKKANYEKGQMVLGCYTSMTALCNYA